MISDVRIKGDTSIDLQSHRVMLFMMSRAESKVKWALSLGGNESILKYIIAGLKPMKLLSLN